MSEGSKGNVIDCNSDDDGELKSNDSDYTPVENKHPSTVKSSSTKKSHSNNYRNKKRKGSNKSLISSKRKTLNSNASKILTIKESLKETKAEASKELSNPRRSVGTVKDEKL